MSQGVTNSKKGQEEQGFRSGSWGTGGGTAFDGMLDTYNLFMKQTRRVNTRNIPVRDAPSCPNKAFS